MRHLLVFSLAILSLAFAACNESRGESNDPEHNALVARSETLEEAHEDLEERLDDLMDEQEELEERLRNTVKPDPIFADAVKRNGVIIATLEGKLSQHDAMRKVHDKYIDAHEHKALGAQEITSQHDLLKRDHVRMEQEHAEILQQIKALESEYAQFGE